MQNLILFLKGFVNNYFIQLFYSFQNGGSPSLKWQASVKIDGSI